MWDVQRNGAAISVWPGHGALAQAPDEVASGVRTAPEPWELGLPPALSPIMEHVVGLHDLLMWISAVILVLVLALIGYACWRFRASRNPTPSRRTHNTVLEITWTAVPALILIVIAIPSFRLLYFQGVVPEVEMTIKAIGRFAEHRTLAPGYGLVSRRGRRKHSSRTAPRRSSQATTVRLELRSSFRSHPITGQPSEP